MRPFIRDNALSLTLLVLFLLSLIGQIVSGHRYYNQTQRDHHQPAVSLPQYLTSGDFVEAVFENWESEFLQMAVFVVLTKCLRQRGSAESKDFDQHEEVDEDPRSHRHDPDAPWPVQRGGIVLVVYKHSLTTALLLLFAISFGLHAAGGARADCGDRQAHGEPCLSTLQYLGSARFWFESFQNWQSEFLSVAALILLSIWLRQHGSPQSKPVHSPHAKTGEH